MSTADTTPSASLDRRPQSPADSKTPEFPAVPKTGAKRKKFPAWLIAVICIVAFGGAGAWYWWQQQKRPIP